VLWILGAKGLLGSALALKCGQKAILSGHELEISNFEALRAFVGENQGITRIINCAAFSQVDAAEQRREEAYLANVRGPENLSLIAQEIGADLIHISTDYVFAGNVKKPQTENDPVGPCNYYGQTKLEGEQKVLSFGQCVIRTSGIFGGKGNNFVSKLLHMLQTQKEVRLTDDQWGRFTYAPDLAGALLQLGHLKGLYQYANTGVATKYEFGLALRSEALLLGLPVVTESIIAVPSSTFPSPCKRPIYSAFDTTKIERHVSIRSWREGLRDYLCAQLPVYL